jgi:hypothetical protein
MTVINNTNNNKSWQGCGPKGILLHCWRECKAVWRSLRKLKIELPNYLVIPFLGIHPKECAPGYNRVTCTPKFIAALFIIAKLWKKLRCPTTNRLRKCGIYTHRVLFSHKEE